MNFIMEAANAGPYYVPPGVDSLRARPPDCPSALWGILVEELSEPCLLSLRPHIGPIASFSVEIAAVGEERVRRLLRLLDEVHKRMLAAEALNRELKDRLRCCAENLDIVGAHSKARTEAHQTTANNLEQARFQVGNMEKALEEANRRLVDASAFWEDRWRSEREQQLKLLIAQQDNLLDII